MDASSTKDGSGVDPIIETLQGEKHEHALKFMFKASNNEAKYKALIVRIKLCNTVGVGSVKAYSDSQLVFCQLNDEYETKDDTMAAYIHWVPQATNWLKSFSIAHIPRS